MGGRICARMPSLHRALWRAVLVLPGDGRIGSENGTQECPTSQLHRTPGSRLGRQSDNIGPACLSRSVSLHTHITMTYELFFAGAGSIALGTLLGAWLSCRLTYRFQQRLLEQQLAFQKEQAVADAELRRKIYDEWHSIFTEFRNMVNTRASQIVGKLSARTPHSQ